MSREAPFDPGDGVLSLRVRVQPGASRDAILGESGGELRIRLTARPVEGAANAALIGLLAKTLGVPKSAIHLISGGASRSKLLRVETQDPQGAISTLLSATGKKPA